jgi:hypothetical protein
MLLQIVSTDRLASTSPAQSAHLLKPNVLRPHCLGVIESPATKSWGEKIMLQNPSVVALILAQLVYWIFSMLKTAVCVLGFGRCFHRPSRSKADDLVVRNPAVPVQRQCRNEAVAPCHHNTTCSGPGCGRTSRRVLLWRSIVCDIFAYAFLFYMHEMPPQSALVPLPIHPGAGANYFGTFFFYES